MTSADQPSAEREPRGARRKRETRDKLLRAAFRLIAERGVAAVAINEITEAADVGFGSFYNHFPSKEAIYEEVFRLVFEEFGDALERLTSDLEDPAEVISVCIRHAILRAELEPLWGRFLLRESLTPSGITRGLAARLMRDIHIGVDEKRLKVADPLAALMMAGGTVMAAIAVQAAHQAEPGAAKRLGFEMKHLAERAAATVLSGLGIRDAEAAKIARRRLPAFQSPPSSSLHERS
jgi:AcrR family transcriptional regulator